MGQPRTALIIGGGIIGVTSAYTLARDGWQVAHVDVSHRPRAAGRSHYNNLQRGFVGAIDLVGVMWLLRRRKRARPTEAGPGRG